MVFNSVDFILFFPIVYLVYINLVHKKQNLLLLAASYFFYGFWDYRFLGLIFISTVVDYYAALRISSATADDRKKYLYLSVMVNLGILGAFKYYNFFMDSAIHMLDQFSIHYTPAVLDVVLPLGISFYTFQTMSYTIDVYRGQVTAVKRFDDFALFVSYFPQLVAGPIERATNLLPQILHPRKISHEDLRKGGYLVLQGFFKKVFIADNLAYIIDPVFAKNDPTGMEIFVALCAFVFQIYGDFSGYSDIARGISRMMGVKLMKNFNLPLFSVNIIDLWKRWHISFTTWLRDYVYYPLGGSRVSSARFHFNNIVTFFISGLWHGANWTFVIWGVYNGVLTSLYRVFAPYLPRLQGDRPFLQGLSVLSRIVFTFLLFAFSGVFFRSQSLQQSVDLMVRLSGGIDFSETRLLEKFVRLVLFLLLIEFWQFRQKSEYALFELKTWQRTAVYIIMFYAILIMGNFDKNEFIYFVF